MASSSRTTRKPGSDVSATSARHLRVKSSTTAKMRKRRRSAKAFDGKSRLQRWFGPCGIAIGARVPSARLRPPRRRTCRRSSRWRRRNFLWFMAKPSRRIRTSRRR